MPRPSAHHRPARIGPWAFACGLLLAVLAWPAFALGLGQIEVKSRGGEPLLAEIPIISSDPSELEQLQARLASPDTFRRIGLEPPTGLVSGLDFAIALDPRGRPVIRITSREPVQQPMLTFLVEVDWGQGRLVREYSALVDTPQTVAAPAQPPIQAPVAAPSNLIERPAATTAAPEPAQAAAAPAEDAGDTTAAEAPAAVPAPAPAPPAGAAAAVTSPGEYGPVEAGQTLGAIAASLSGGSGHSLQQVMLALLRANPEAFIGGNVNLVRQGAVLRVPPRETWSETSVAEANAVVREHVSRWRERRRAIAQPAVEAGATAATTPATAGEAREAAPARTAEARLEIVPPSDGRGDQAGTRTGTVSGGEGDMLQQQELVQARESLAARDAEVQELKARLAELEQLQQQQQQLIQMKDGELAAVQQRLAQGNAQDGVAAGSAWPWLALLALVAAVLAWGWRRRRAQAPARATGSVPGFASPSAPATRKLVVPPSPSASADSAAATTTAAQPSWQSGTAAAAPAAKPRWHAGDAATGTAETTQDDHADVAPMGHERIELARAYIDLGDTETARGLLQEVVDYGEADARGEARRLLQDLV